MTKTQLKIKLLALCGWLSYKWRRLPSGVYCFNYHRIGDPEVDDFDPNVFSATVEEFDSQLILFKQHFTIISVDELVAMTKDNSAITKRYAVITFDDGYIDNYTKAYPVLQKHEVSAAFYIPIEYIDSPQIPWWDEIAWLIKNTKIKALQLSFWQEKIFINSLDINQSIVDVLKAVKSDAKNSMKNKLIELRKATNTSMPEHIKNKPLFMNWQQLKTMSENNMHIGSHTCSHNILSHLTESEQRLEVVRSKKELEAQLNIEITSLAYPVGKHYAFNETTMRVTNEAGYTIAFSFISGIIRALGIEHRFQLRRMPIDFNSTNEQLKYLIITSDLST